jgi:hypothetical protein
VQKLYEARKVLAEGDLKKMLRLGRLFTVSPLPSAA